MMINIYLGNMEEVFVIATIITLSFCLSKFIETKYQELEKKKTVPDEKIIQEFPDEIFVPTNVSDNFMNGSFNSVLSKLRKKVKKKII